MVLIRLCLPISNKYQLKIACLLLRLLFTFTNGVDQVMFSILNKYHLKIGLFAAQTVIFIASMNSGVPFVFVYLY
jgi:hypothetical protein